LEEFVKKRICMKQLTSLLVLSLALLSGCGTTEKKDQSLIEDQSAFTPEPFHYVENPTDTTLPTTPTARNSDLEVANEPAQSERSE
jgi:uncharacterized lipoprotein